MQSYGSRLLGIHRELEGGENFPESPLDIAAYEEIFSTHNSQVSFWQAYDIFRASEILDTDRFRLDAVLAFLRTLEWGNSRWLFVHPIHWEKKQVDMTQELWDNPQLAAFFNDGDEFAEVLGSVTIHDFFNNKNLYIQELIRAIQVIDSKLESLWRIFFWIDKVRDDVSDILKLKK